MAPLYVQYGCGFSVGEDWVNFDNSPTLVVERLPIIGSLLGRFAGNPQKFPACVRYGDIAKGLPVPDNSARGVYASHVLEHLAYDDFKVALRNTFKMLEPGGVFRLVVPDLFERAHRYVQEATAGSADASWDFMTSTRLGMKQRPRTLVARARRMYGSSHLWMWDEPSMTKQLEMAGFVEIRRCSFGDSDDPMFSQVEDPGRFLTASTGIAELAMSARKPGEVREEARSAQSASSPA